MKTKVIELESDFYIEDKGQSGLCGNYTRVTRYLMWILGPIKIPIHWDTKVFNVDTHLGSFCLGAYYSTKEYNKLFDARLQMKG